MQICWDSHRHEEKRNFSSPKGFPAALLHLLPLPSLQHSLLRGELPGCERTGGKWECDELLQTDHMTFSMYFLLSLNSDNLSLARTLAAAFPSGNRSLSVSEPPLPLFHLISSPFEPLFPKREGAGCGGPRLPADEWSLLAACLFLGTIFCQSVEHRV